jgi:hypothetical protein
MHSAEGAMFPISKPALSFGEISDYWSRDRPPASWEEVLRTLKSAWWLGELRGNSVNSPLQLLKKMFTSMRHRDDLGIVFIVGDCAGPLPVELPDGSPQVDLRYHIRVPSSSTENWDEAACRDPYHALAKTCSKESYPELTVGFTLVELSYEEFSTWCTKRGFSVPTFWVSPDEARRRHTGAASSAGSNDDAVAPRKKRKTWQPKPGKLLTATEIDVVRAMNELWPDGRLDLRAKARHERINSQLGYPVSPRTIQRTLKKVHHA